MKSARSHSHSAWILGILLAAPLAVSGFNEPRALGESKKMKVASERPEILENVGITEKVGDSLDLGLSFSDADGHPVKLADYFATGRPVILSPVYYTCPTFCNFHLNGIMEGISQLEWSVAKDYEYVAFSFDSREKPEQAQVKKTAYLNSIYKRPEGPEGIHFLTGSEEAIKKLASQIGFRFAWNADENEWAHASTAVVLTPEGKISRYLHGITFEPQNIKLALNEASAGKLGNIIDSVVLYCFQWNPKQGKFTLAAFRVMQLGGLLTIIVLAAWLIPFWLRARRETA